MLNTLAHFGDSLITNWIMKVLILYSWEFQRELRHLRTLKDRLNFTSIFYFYFYFYSFLSIMAHMLYVIETNSTLYLIFCVIIILDAI